MAAQQRIIQKEKLSTSSEIFDFFKLPNELKFKIIESIPENDPETFCTLLAVSKTMRAICLAGQWKFIRHIPEIIFYTNSTQARLDVGDDRQVCLSTIVRNYIKIHADVLSYVDIFNEVECWRAIKMCETHDLTADILCTQHDVCCSSSTLQHFLNIIQVSQWIVQRMVRKSALKGLKIEGAMIIDTDCDDETFLSLCIDRLILMSTSEITDAALNVYLTQWLAGTRIIGCLDVHWTLSTRNLDVLFNGISPNPIWTPETHSNSLLSHIPLEIVNQRSQTNGMDRLYTIFSSRNVHNYLIIIISETSFKIDNCPLTEVGLLKRYEELLLQ